MIYILVSLFVTLHIYHFIICAQDSVSIFSVAYCSISSTDYNLVTLLSLLKRASSSYFNYIITTLTMYNF